MRPDKTLALPTPTWPRRPEQGAVDGYAVAAAHLGPEVNDLAQPLDEPPLGFGEAAAETNWVENRPRIERAQSMVAESSSPHVCNTLLRVQDEEARGDLEIAKLDELRPRTPRGLGRMFNPRHPSDVVLPFFDSSAFLVFVAALAACLNSWPLSPGWLFWDTAQQWKFASSLAEHGIPNRLSDLGITNQWPILNTLVKVPFVWLGHAVWLFALVQAFSLHVALIWTARVLLPRGRQYLVVYGLVASLPFVWNYAVFQSSDVPTAVGLLAFYAILVRSQYRRGTGSYVAAIACAVVIGFLRLNAVPASCVMVLLAEYWHRDVLKRTWKLRTALAIALAVAVAVQAALEKTAYRVNTAVPGILLRVWVAATRSDDETLKENLRLLLRPGVRVEPLTERCLADGQWCESFHGAIRWNDVREEDVRALLTTTIRRQPLAFAGTLFQFAGFPTGVSSPLRETEIGRRDAPEPFPEAKMSYDDTREAALRLHNRSLEWFGHVFGRPFYLALAATAVLFALGQGRLAGGFGAVSSAYLVPLVVLGPAFDFRYALPITLPAVVFLAYGLACGGWFFIRLCSYWRFGGTDPAIARGLHHRTTKSAERTREAGGAADARGADGWHGWGRILVRLAWRAMSSVGSPNLRLLVAVGWVGVLVAAFAPGLMSGDTLDQLAQGSNGIYNTWHPPLVSFLQGGTLRLFGSPAPIFTAQLSGLALAFWWLLRRHESGWRRYAASALLVMALALPPTWALGVTLWGDVLMAAAMLGAVVAVTQRRLGLTLACLVTSVLMRHNALPAVGPLLFAGLIRAPAPLLHGRLRAVRVALATVVTLAAMALVPAVVERLLGAEQRWPGGSLLLFDAVGVYAQRPEALEGSTFRARWTPGDVQRIYTPTAATSIHWGDASVPRVPVTEVRSLRPQLGVEWRRLLATFPGDYLAHRWSAFRSLLGIDGVWYPFHTQIDPNPYGFCLRVDGAVHQALVAFRDAALRETPMFRGWVWVLLAAIVSVVGAATKRAVMFFTGASGLAYALFHFVVCVSADFRYLYWIVLSVCAALALWLELLQRDVRGAARRGTEVRYS